MRIKKLILKRFRNYQEINIDFDRGINIFIGLNAQGKTNILEALYYCAMGKSHRASFDEEMIQWQQQSSVIDIIFSRQDVNNHLRFHLREKQKKEIILNNCSLPPRDVIGSLNAVLFSPEDLLLVKGAPVMRRRFIDNEISQANPAYYKLLMNYNRMLMQRNNLLKKIRDGRATTILLDNWDDQLVPAAARIVTIRRQSLKKMNMLANLIHRRITDNRENLAIHYLLYGSENDVDSIKIIGNNREKEIAGLEEWFCRKFIANRREDIARGSTSIGPHRDDVAFYVNEKSLRTYGSQGQQRTGVLSVKLAELEYIKSETGEYPILLLDDVMSELDFSRRLELLSFIKEKVQTFITATDDVYFPDVKAAKYFRVLAGTLVEKTE